MRFKRFRTQNLISRHTEILDAILLYMQNNKTGQNNYTT